MIDRNTPNFIEADSDTAPLRGPNPSLDGDLNLISAPYLPKVRACHDIVGLLKRTRPSVRGQVIELEGIVTRAHQSLSGATSRAGAADAQCSIDSAYQMLLELRRSRSEF